MLAFLFEIDYANRQADTQTRSSQFFAPFQGRQRLKTIALSHCMNCLRYRHKQQRYGIWGHCCKLKKVRCTRDCAVFFLCAVFFQIEWLIGGMRWIRLRWMHLAGRWSVGEAAHGKLHGKLITLVGVIELRLKLTSISVDENISPTSTLATD